MTTEIDPALLAIYKKSDYRVHDAAVSHFVMHIDEPCEPLRALMLRSGVHSACFVSAYNPRSEPRTEAENVRAQECLRQDVSGLGLTFLEGVGEDPGGDCAGEPCLLVLGASRNDTESLGRRYGQNAVLWMEGDGIPKLMLLR
ncbi:MAG: DUF3293 domain-containing protein [Betaproteobacteria bacterium]|nr:DUF3293 domain-containing protein [Betaproteobacteria bacterium]